MALRNDLLNEVSRRIAAGRVILPSPPDNISRIRAVLNDPDASINRISTAIATDSGLALRVLKVANSALHRGQQDIETLQQAVARLGHNLVNTLATSHALTQMFVSTPPAFKPLAQYLHQHSQRVAAYSYALARHLRGVSPEDALLAGLVHDIGYLPMLSCLDPAELGEPFEFLAATREEKTLLTDKLLALWRFPAALSQAVREHEQTGAAVNGHGRLTDILTVANLNALRNDPHPDARLDWSGIAAFSRLGIDVAVPLDQVTPLEAHLQRAWNMLGVQ